jgi:hypothetical protein
MSDQIVNNTAGTQAVACADIVSMSSLSGVSQRCRDQPRRAGPEPSRVISVIIPERASARCHRR